MGLPEFMVSTTANSRLRSWRIRAIRYRYLARSLPGSRDQVRSWARRAAPTARSTSAFEAWATLARGSSVAGLMTWKVFLGRAGMNSLSMKRPYSGRIWTWSVASGAGAYSHGTPAREAIPHEAVGRLGGRLSAFLVSVMTA